MVSLVKQRGMNTLSILLLLVTFGVTLTVFLRLGPVYLDNFYIKNALETLARNHPDDLGQLSKDTIRRELGDYYSINNVRGDAAKALEIDRRQNKTLIMITYEVRVPLMGNVDAVVKFDNVLDSSAPDKCCKAPKK